MTTATLHRAELRQAPPRVAVLPPDVRLMRATANLLIAMIGVATLLAAALWLARQPAFALRAIRIEGDVARVTVPTIRNAAMPHLSGNFFTADLGAAKRAFEAVPWVRQAEIRRAWPSRLIVRLEEHRAAALWAPEAGVGDAAPTDKLVNTHGEVFEANIGDVEDDNLPTLSGPEGSAAHMLALLERLRPLVEAPWNAHIDTLSLSTRGSWRATLDSGADIELGRGSDDEVLARTARFVATMPQVASRYQRPLEYADLRHPDGYAVRLRGITTGVEPSPTKAH